MTEIFCLNILYTSFKLSVDMVKHLRSLEFDIMWFCDKAVHPRSVKLHFKLALW